MRSHSKTKIIASFALRFAIVVGIFTAASILLSSCGTRQVELSQNVPKDALVYMETPDLGKMLRTTTENPRFKQMSEKAKDFSALDGVSAAVVITGFQTSEQRLTEQNSSLNFKPQFAAVINTGLWNWQTRGFVEEVLGNFVNEAYGGEITLQTTDHAGGNRYEWKSSEGNKAFAFVKDGLVFFGNDEAAVNKCIAAAKGEIERIDASENFKKSRGGSVDQLAFGFVSPDGIVQLSNVAAVFAAVAATDEDAGRSLVSGFLPNLLKNTTQELFWTARQNGDRIEDSYSAKLNPEIANIFHETLQISSGGEAPDYRFIPADAFSVTRYDLKEPLIAWRSVILVAAEAAGAPNSQIFNEFSKNLLLSYGISDPELFLRSVRGELVTAQLSADLESSIAVARISDREQLKGAFSGIVDIDAPPQDFTSASVWISKDKLISAAITENTIVFGNMDAVRRALETKSSGANLTENAAFSMFSQKRSAVTTFTRDLGSAEKIVKVLGNGRNLEAPVDGSFVSRTEIKDKRLVRTTVSDFGFIGSLIAQFSR